MGNKPSGVPTSGDAEKASSDMKGEAERLLAEAGSSEMAQKAAGAPAADSKFEASEAFARQWGFASYLSMFEASKPVSSSDQKNWLVTNVGANRWIAWNEQDLRADATFTSFEEAAQHVGQPVSEVNKPAGKPPPTG